MGTEAPKPPASGTSGTTPPMQSVADEAQQRVGQAVDQVRQQGMSQIASQKDVLAGTVGSVAHALHETSRQLKQGNEAQVGEYVDRVAEQVDHLSNHLRGRDVDELISDAESFARRQPALFLGGAFLIGLVASRFLKSSHPDQQRSPYYTSPYASPPGLTAAAPQSTWPSSGYQPSASGPPSMTTPQTPSNFGGTGTSSPSTARSS